MVIEIVANLVVHPLKRWIAFLLEPQENLLVDALQASRIGVGVGVGTASPYCQCLADALLFYTSLMVTAVLVAQTEMEKSFRMLGRLQSISIVTIVLLPDVTERPLNEVVPWLNTRETAPIVATCDLVPVVASRKGAW
jgi:hypothetical protein